VTGGSEVLACFGRPRWAFRPVCWGGFLAGRLALGLLGPSRASPISSDSIDLAGGVAKADGRPIAFLEFE